MKIAAVTSMFVVVCVSASAGVLTLSPAGGAISAAPGQTVGWGFDAVSSPSRWISFEASFILSESQPIGTYSDFIGLQGGPSNFSLPPASPDWIESFDLSSQQGLGAYAIDPSAGPNVLDYGTIRVLYATYSADPTSCGSCLVDQTSVDVPFQIALGVQSAPEPPTGPVLLIACFLMVIRGSLFLEAVSGARISSWARTADGLRWYQAFSCCCLLGYTRRRPPLLPELSGAPLPTPPGRGSGPQSSACS